MIPSSREPWQQNSHQSTADPDSSAPRPPLSFGGPLPPVQPTAQSSTVSQSSVVLPPFFSSSSSHQLPALSSMGQRSSPTQRTEISAPPPTQSYSFSSLTSAAAHPTEPDRPTETREAREYATMDELRRQAELRDRDMRHRQSGGEQHILHQPVAVPPHVQGVHGPNGLLGSQGAAAASLMAPGPGLGNVPAIFSSATHHPGAVALQAQPQQSQVLMPFPPAPLGQGAQVNQAQQPILNDALSYLDQVKGQFSQHPDVYNRFLDIMKEFKSGAIDTPGVIERVSQLFAGNPALIQGFNTFLPPGYRIECGLNDDPNAIRVTTPMGTTHSTLQARPNSPLSHGNSANAAGPYQSTTNQIPWAQHTAAHEAVAQESRLPPVIYGQPPGPSNVSPDAHREQLVGLSLSQDQRNTPALSHAAALMRSSIGIPATPTTDAMAPLSGVAIANGGTPITVGPGGVVEKRGPVEFNHAISYVNKIKNRFASQPDIYKQFLEILQTYQRESKPIGDVYAQVTRLFESAPDLLEDFKQFLPESAAHANAVSRRQAAEDVFAMSNTRAEPGFTATTSSAQAAHLTPRADQQRLPPMGNFAPTPSSSKENKRKRATDRQPPVMAPISATDTALVSGRAAFGQHVSKKPKSAHAPAKPPIVTTDTTVVVPSLVPPEPVPLPPATMITASPDDVQMIDKIRKHINNKTTYTELIKLLNLYNQDAITSAYALHRLQSFIGNNAEIMIWLKNLLGEDDTEHVVSNASRPLNTRISLSRCRSYGPSYRRLPKQEMNSLCSGRDELCKAVLNDEWASHPTWDSEEAGFVAHKKTVFEETLHRIEEERHDYDSNIECLAQTISLVESIVKALETKTPEDRRHYRTDNKLGGQSEFIWKRTIYKLYGRENGHTVIARMLDNTHVVAPPLLGRLRDTRERWKAAQRQWNEVWRQQTLQVYHKSLDHQGTNQRATHDKRQFQPKTLQQEIKARYEDMKNVRSAKGDSLSTDPEEQELRRTGYQYIYRFKNKEVLMDALHLVLTQFDHKNGADDPQLASRMRSFFALVLSMDPAQLRSTSEDPQSPESEQSQPSESAAPTRTRSTRKSRSLYQAVLDKDKNKVGASGSASRDSTPAAASAAEDESTSLAGVAEEDIVMTADAELDTWFPIAKTGSKGDNSATANDGPTAEASNSASEDLNEMQKDADVISPEKTDDQGLLDEQYERTEFHMYCNSILYCFMRLFGILYERLVAVYDYEQDVKLLVGVQRIEKPAHRLFMIDKVPGDYFEDTTDSANYYRQVVNKFEMLIKGHDSVTQTEVEDMLRRYYLNCGYRLYHLDKLLAQMDRLGVMMLSNDKEKLSEQLLKLYRQDRVKEKTTLQDELAYRKQAMKYLASKEKEGETSYRVTYNVKAASMSIQMFDRESPHFERENMTPQDRLRAYLLEFARIAPTEGVTLPPLYRDSRWPGLPRPQASLFSAATAAAAAAAASGAEATGEDEATALTTTAAINRNNSSNDENDLDLDMDQQQQQQQQQHHHPRENADDDDAASPSPSPMARVLGTNLMSFQVMVDNLHITFDPESEEFSVRMATAAAAAPATIVPADSDVAWQKLLKAAQKMADRDPPRLLESVEVAVNGASVVFEGFQEEQPQQQQPQQQPDEDEPAAAAAVENGEQEASGDVPMEDQEVDGDAVVDGVAEDTAVAEEPVAETANQAVEEQKDVVAENEGVQEPAEGVGAEPSTAAKEEDVNMDESAQW